MNELSVNMIYKAVDSGHFHRVLWVSPNRQDVYVFDCVSRAMPILANYTELLTQIQDGIYLLSDSDPFLRIVSEDGLDGRSKEIRERAWKLMSPVVLSEPDVYVKKQRGDMLAKMLDVSSMSVNSFYRYLKLYWCYGKNINAFLPRYDNCGAPDRERGKTDRKRGRPRKYGDSEGVNVDDTLKAVFESAIKKYYHTRNENTLQYAYDVMIKDHFTRFVPQIDGVIKAELLTEDKLPTIAQFRYWYNKKHGVTEKLIKREGETKFALKHRAITGKSDFGVRGPCAEYQIDATIGDVYLVSRFNRADIIGRPIIYFIIDVFSRMIAGMYVGLEGPSRNGAMMAIANACSDKVKYCAEYGVTITDAEWPCRHIPYVILADRGEMESMSVDMIVNALNVRIDNTVAYRGDMKGIIEQQFNKINETALKHLPGHVKPDINERGAEDYRLNATLDIFQLTKILIQCVLYHNNHHLHKTFERTADMIADDIPPVPLQVWNWGITHCTGSLRSYPEEAVKLALMPTDTATVTAKGIRFNKLYYLCDRAVTEGWLEKARAKGSFKVKISYDSRNMSRIYIRETDGSADICKLTEWQEKYTDRCLEEIIKLHESEKEAAKKHETREMASKADLFAAIDSVVSEATEMARQTDVPKSKRARTANIRDNRRNEKEANRRDEAFLLDDEESAFAAETDVAEDSLEETSLSGTLATRDNKPGAPSNETEWVKYADEVAASPQLAEILKQLEERLNG